MQVRNLRKFLVATCLVIALGHFLGNSANGQESKQPLSAAGTPAKAVRLSPGSPEFRKHVDRLIEDLGSESFAIRETASNELRDIGVAVRTTLERASQSEEREVSLRAKAILAGFPKLTHTIVDAMDAPIPLATVHITIRPRGAAGQGPPTDEVRSELTVADELGRIGFPEVAANEFQATVRVTHPEYGHARSDVDLIGNAKQIRLPLLREGSEIRNRAVSGIVVTPDGQPVVGAVIQCGTVRTAGEGLINGLYPRGDALTDDQGRFSYYLPNTNSRQERGDLIPPNSNYELTIDVPDNDSFFPTAGRYSNSKPVRIELARPVEKHRFRWEAVGGGFLDKPAQVPNIRVEFLQVRDGDQRRIPLNTTSLIQGRRILEGTYSAIFYDNGKPVQYQPISVTKGSPEELVFRLPNPITYHGRVMQGATNEPIRSAFVMGWSSTSRNNFALLTPEDWKLLRDAPVNPPLDHPAMKRISQFYGVQALVRTDADGRFEITRQPGQEFYGLMAFDEDFVPFKVHVGGLKPDPNHRIDVATLPLFPAAKVIVRPVVEANRISISPQWLPTEDEQPSWMAQFRAVQQGSGRDFEYVHWLTINEPQPIYVPAGVRMRLRFDVPYNDERTPATVDTLLRLERGATVDIGDVKFALSLPVVVQVVNQAGRPVEGFAVRRKYDAINAWSIAHNTDKDGKATFHAHPNSQGQFRVSDLPGPQEITQAKNLFVDFRTGDAVPSEPFRITVTDEQIALLRGVNKP